jgi:hypothetical protein
MTSILRTVRMHAGSPRSSEHVAPERRPRARRNSTQRSATSP